MPSPTANLTAARCADLKLGDAYGQGKVTSAMPRGKGRLLG